MELEYKDIERESYGVGLSMPTLHQQPPLLFVIARKQ
jgi:hypothetical protein